jgi:hypothetical protein
MLDKRYKLYVLILIIVVKQIKILETCARSKTPIPDVIPAIVNFSSEHKVIYYYINIDDFNRRKNLIRLQIGFVMKENHVLQVLLHLELKILIHFFKGLRVL